MKFLIFAAVIAVAAADVSHLNRNYLPPDNHHHQHAEVSHVDAGIGADSYTPAQLITEEQHFTADIPQAIGAESYAPESVADQEQPIALGRDPITYTPAHLIEHHEHHEVSAPIGGDSYTSAGLTVEEFNGDNHIPTVVYGAAAQGVQDSVAQYVSQSQPQVVHHHHQDASVGIDTQYGSNGGYIY